MTSTVPNLDTIDFERLVEKGRAQIPRYAPAWTDHNLHDPGMTLIDLLAWIVDQQIYRVGFVSDRHLRSFAALLGQHTRTPQPATGLIWPDESPDQGRLLREGAVARCVRHPEIDFALSSEVFTTTARLTKVVFLAAGVEREIGVTSPSAGSVPLAAAAPGAGTSVVFRFDRPLVEHSATGTISLGFDMDEPPGGPPGKHHAWGPLDFVHRSGTDDWAAVDVLSDSTLGLATTGTVRLDIPGGSDASELLVSLDSGFFPIAPQLRHVAVNVLEVVQEDRHDSGVLGRGNGTADQHVDFTTDDIVYLPGADAVEVSVTDSSGTEGGSWQERDRLDDSGPEDEHYVRHPDRLVFGNGVNGKRPPRDTQIVHGEFSRTRGEAGNLRAGLVWSVPALDSRGGTYGRNRRAFSGGADAWNLATLGAAARSAATSRRVQLTNSDLEQRALQLDGMSIVRAEVLSGFDARLPDRSVSDVRTIVVFPHHEPNVEVAPLADEYLEVVAARLESGRVLGERLVVQGPQIVRVDVRLGVIVEPGAAPTDVSERIRTRVTDRLSDISFDADIDPWPLGRMVTTEEIKSLAANLAGVRAVPTCEISRVTESLGTAPLAIAADAIAVAATITVEPQLFGAMTESSSS